MLSTLEDALAVLRISKADRDSEHRREFLSYWSQRSTPSNSPYLSVLGAGQRSRDIVFCGDATKGMLFAEDADALRQWICRIGSTPPSSPGATCLVWLTEPLLPEQFPKNGAEVISLVGDGVLNPHVRPGRVLPVLFGTEINGTSVYACVEICGIGAKDAAKGFRPRRPMPPAIVVDTFRGRKATLREVRRVDHAWVHGRGRHAETKALREKRVAVVGCGSLGSFLAIGLARAGVGSLLLVDFDRLEPSNTGRHLLGMAAVGDYKSLAVAKRLEADFPDGMSITSLTSKIDAADNRHLSQLAGCDLVIAAGIDIAGELALSKWRSSLSAPPPLVWTWFEEFAIAGHAAGVLGNARIEDALDDDGVFRMRLSSAWPDGVAQAVEAGCGVAYQPYSACDMMGTVNVANRLSLDILHGRVKCSVVRSWLGNREQAIVEGANLATEFDRSYCEISRNWPWPQ